MNNQQNDKLPNYSDEPPPSYEQTLSMPIDSSKSYLENHCHCLIVIVEFIWLFAFIDFRNLKKNFFWLDQLLFINFLIFFSFNYFFFSFYDFNSGHISYQPSYAPNVSNYLEPNTPVIPILPNAPNQLMTNYGSTVILINEPVPSQLSSGNFVCPVCNVSLSIIY